MKLIVVAVGSLRERPVREIADDYEKRLAKYARVEQIEVPDREGTTGLAGAVARAAKLSQGTPQPGRKTGAARAQNTTQRASGDASIVALDSRGEQLDSTAFAKFVEKLGSRGKGEIVFVLGGRDGISQDVLGLADHVLSFGKMTFPHRIARVLLLEQLYRAMTILRGEPYGTEER